MGALIRKFDWAATPLGSPDKWPYCLRTTVSNLLHSKFPMLLWWGEENIQFYNDAFRPSLGRSGKHPLALGQPAQVCWQEIWDVISPNIKKVEDQGEGIWMEDQLVPIYRNGKVEDVYWTYSYSPVSDDNGVGAGMLVTCTETTDKVKGYRGLEESIDQLRFALEAAELATWDYTPATGRFAGNYRLKEWFGLGLDGEIDLNMAKQMIIPQDRERVMQAIHTALDQSSGGGYDIEYTIMHPHNGKPRIVRAKGRAWFTPEKKAYRFNGILQDVTDQVVARRKLEEGERSLRNIILQAPVGMCLLEGPEHMISIANRRMFEFWGRQPDHMMNKPMFVALPEAANQGFEELLANVFETGESFSASEVLVTLPRNNRLETVLINFAFEPVRQQDGSITGLLAMASDVTAQVLARRKVEEARESLRLSLEAAELGSFEINPHTNEIFASARFDSIFDIGHSQNRELYIDSIVPEDRAAREAAYKTAYRTGLLEYEARVVWRDGSVHWIRVWGNVYFDDERQPLKLLGVVQDITARRKAEDELRNTAERLEIALQAGQLGSYELDLHSGEIYCNAQCKANFGLKPSEGLSFEKLVSLLLPSDRDGMQEAVRIAVATRTLYNAEYRITWPDGKIRWVRASGATLYSPQGKPEKIVGITVDITEQKEFAEELGKQVSERTIALESKNQELERSNANLEEFAYAASHDLKEPIRKIHFFSGRLKHQLSNRMTEEDATLFAPIERSTERMSELIDDLLVFSHVSQRPRQKETIDLNYKLQLVLEDLELDIQQKQAVIRSGHLPSISGYRRQIQQLFHNLITNSLKYTKPGVIPEIDITSSLVSGFDAGLGTGRMYHLVQFRDNGIGFEQEYAEKIFHMFTRLHGRNEYSGTGVGLSIVKKVVENHNGYINAQSEPGRGAVFNIYLPAIQQ